MDLHLKKINKNFLKMVGETEPRNNSVHGRYLVVFVKVVADIVDLQLGCEF